MAGRHIALDVDGDVLAALHHEQGQRRVASGGIRRAGSLGSLPDEIPTRVKIAGLLDVVVCRIGRELVGRDGRGRGRIGCVELLDERFGERTGLVGVHSGDPVDHGRIRGLVGDGVLDRVQHVLGGGADLVLICAADLERVALIIAGTGHVGDVDHAVRFERALGQILTVAVDGDGRLPLCRCRRIGGGSAGKGHAECDHARGDGRQSPCD